MTSNKNSWLPSVGTVLTILAVVVGATIYLETKFSDINTRLDKDEAAIKTLNSNSDDKTKALVKELLASAVSALPANPTAALRATNVASALVTALAQQKKAADAPYFADIVNSVNLITDKSQDATIRQAAGSVRSSLADYRSALNPLPTPPTPWTFKKMDHGIDAYSNATVEGGYFDAASITGTFIDVHLVFGKPLPHLIGTVIQNAKQPLDGVNWDHVVFINSHISYGGGPVRLVNVMFINCTFDLPPTPEGAKVSDYAALQQSELNIGS